jgi:hypothetical protein
MAEPGPKPVGLERLKFEALKWTNHLLALRDGQLGSIYKVEWGPFEMVNLGTEKVRGRSTRRVLVAEIFPVDKVNQDLPPLLRVGGAKKDWIIFQPVVPDPRVWAQIKNSKSIKQVHQISRGIRMWGRKIQKRGHWLHPEFADAFRSHAGGLLNAKQLPQYPRSNRRRSDDKRIEFIAKVMAGLTLNLLPTYTLKRLAGWRCPESVWETSPKFGIEKTKERLKRRVALSMSTEGRRK